MKKRTKLFSVLMVLLLAFSVCSATFNAKSAAAESAPAVGKVAASTVIKLQLGSPVMTVNGQEQSIDENGTVPVSQNNRTLIPVSAVVEAMGGVEEWDGTSQTVTSEKNLTNLRLGGISLL